jgi:hypothetical protein
VNAEVRWEFERAEIVARCIEVARQCLEGDPFREVPALDVEETRLFELYDGGDVDRESIEELVHSRREPRPAFAVAANALATAKMASGALL